VLLLAKSCVAEVLLLADSGLLLLMAALFFCS